MNPNVKKATELIAKESGYDFNKVTHKIKVLHNLKKILKAEDEYLFSDKSVEEKKDFIEMTFCFHELYEEKKMRTEKILNNIRKK